MEASMRKTVFTLFALVVGLLAASRPAAAHHGAAAFENDPAKRLVLKGTVAEWIWANPHTFLQFDVKGEKPAPAPRRDISGVWEPAAGAGAGVNANGAQLMPSDGKPEHELPYTPEGRAAFLSHKPTFGVTMVPSALTNDPMPGCDPQGFPRIVLHNFRTSRIIQTPENLVILYEFNKKWRTIWTDGRQLPKDAKDVPEPRWR